MVECSTRAIYESISCPFSLNGEHVLAIIHLHFFLSKYLQNQSQIGLQNSTTEHSQFKNISFMIGCQNPRKESGGKSGQRGCSCRNKIVALCSYVMYCSALKPYRLYRDYDLVNFEIFENSKIWSDD
uniref:Uncharacterized protein n=1 Tax=Salix viminalis TaxID=40686 RepID=A0A6N2MMC3_SALVM